MIFPKKNKNKEKYKVYKNNMNLCFGDNGNDELLCKEFKETKNFYNENNPLILFVFNNTNKTNRDYSKYSSILHI